MNVVKMERFRVLECRDGHGVAGGFKGISVPNKMSQIHRDQSSRPNCDMMLEEPIVISRSEFCQKVKMEKDTSPRQSKKQVLDAPPPLPRFKSFLAIAQKQQATMPFQPVINQAVPDTNRMLEEPISTQAIQLLSGQHWVTPGVRRDLVRLICGLTPLGGGNSSQCRDPWKTVRILDHWLAKNCLQPGDAQKLVEYCLKQADQDEVEKLQQKKGVGELSPEESPVELVRIWTSTLKLEPNLVNLAEMLTELSLTDPWLAKCPASTIAAGSLGVVLSLRKQKDKVDISQISDLTSKKTRELVAATLRVSLLLTEDPFPSNCPIRSKYRLTSLFLTLSKRRPFTN